MARLFLVGATFALLLVLGGQEGVVAKKLGLVSLLSAEDGGAELDALRSENLSLRAALEACKELEALLPDLTKRGVSAGVLSSYPFNFKNTLTLSRGADAGIRSGGTAVFRGALVGQVTETSGKTSVLMTLFDPRLELAVRIGSKGVDAVLKGGAQPTVTLVAKDAPIMAGDAVTAADPALPLGLAVGEIDEVRNEPSAPFKEATLHLPYRIHALRAVSVLEPAKEQ